MKIPPRFVIEDDDIGLLRRFTAFIDRVTVYARYEYARKLNYRNMESPMENLPSDKLSYEDPLPVSKDDFNFEEGKLSTAFTELNLLRRRILTLIFVEGLSAQETADKLGCSVDYVYLQKHRTLKKLRDQLMEGGDKHGE